MSDNDPQRPADPQTGSDEASKKPSRPPRRRRPAAAARPAPETSDGQVTEKAGAVPDGAAGGPDRPKPARSRTRSRGRRRGSSDAEPSDKQDKKETGPAAAKPQPDVTAEVPETRPRPARQRRSSPKAQPETAPPPDPSEESSEDAPPDATAKVNQSRKRRGRSSGRRGREEISHLPQGPRTMLITTGGQRVQIAVMEERELVEHYVANKEDRSLVGNIYLGRVQNVLPGMEAAFLDIGENKNAVLYAGEVGFDEEVEGPRPRIETMLKSGQSVLAQVTKDAMGSKGARLTTEISIAGRYLVLVPRSDFVGISRRLPEDERKRLRDITARLRPAEHGLIVRTAAEGIDEADIERDVKRLERIWKEVEQKSKKAKAPKALYSEPELVIRVVRDLFTSDVEKIVVDDESAYDELREYVEELTPDMLDRLELYREGLPLFEKFHVVEQIRKAVDRKVWLKSGGNIVIERTEALTVIDVNSGKFVGKSNLEETVLHTNLEAAEEVAKQLRLRDMGGIIVIDFIDMMHERNRDELMRVFKNALAKDKTRTQVAGSVSDLGLVQMTRKRISEGLLEAFSTPCPNCEGRGIVLSEIE